MTQRWTRRTLTVIAGLALGWYAAGLMPARLFSQTPAPAADHAAAPDTQPAGAVPHHAATAHREATPAPEGEEKTSEGEAGAAALVPQEPIGWYQPVLAGAAALFAAALVLGIPALKFRGPEPAELPDPAAQDHDDDHAQSDHGQGGH